MRDSRSPFASFVPSFLSSSKLEEKTRVDYARYLNEFDLFTGQATLQGALTLENAQKWVDVVSERGPWAAKNAAAYLKSFASWVHKRGYLPGPGGVSVLHLLRAETPPQPVYEAFTEDQLDAIWKALAERPNRERYRSIAYVRLLNDAGLKTTQARSLLLDDVRLLSSNRGSVTVRAANSSDKDERRRLDGKTVIAIREYIRNERKRFSQDGDEPLFITEKGKRFTPNGFGAWIRRISVAINRATGISWNSSLMRHTWKEEAGELIRDDDLRRRCADLLAAEGDYDRAVREACTVLEDRVRGLISAPNALIGTRLMDAAFWGNPVKLRLSDHDGEQEGVSQMYRGLMAFYRNPVGHRLHDDLDRSEALHVVSWIDHLLWLIANAGQYKESLR
jgi:uncharacterized protein (TIGR02391 family)